MDSGLRFPSWFLPSQLIFEAVRSGFDGRIAIDDVSFAKRPCSVPSLCSFEGQRCGYESYGNVHWLHRSAHSGSGSGPRTDHTLETQRGDDITRPAHTHIHTRHQDMKKRKRKRGQTTARGPCVACSAF